MRHLSFHPLLLAGLLVTSCSAFEYQPYDARVTGETDINNKNIALIEKSCTGKDSIRFAVISDTQRWYDETQDFVNILNKRHDIDFVIHGGDMSDFGLTKEFLWQRDILNKLDVPYVVIIGNHDCLGDGAEVFERVFGQLNFSFTASTTKFVCINSNALEYDYSNPVPNFSFIESQLDTTSSAQKKTVFCMHARPYSDEFDNNVAKVFQYEVKMFPHLQFCLSAHDHHVEADDLFGDGVMYYASANIAKRSYLVFTIYKKEGYKYEVVNF